MITLKIEKDRSVETEHSVTMTKICSVGIFALDPLPKKLLKVEKIRKMII